MTCVVRHPSHRPRTAALDRRSHGGAVTIRKNVAQPIHRADTVKPTDMPSLIYRRLQYCDVCGGPLAAGEMLAGICRACRTIPPPRQRVSRVTRDQNWCKK